MAAEELLAASKYLPDGSEECEQSLKTDSRKETLMLHGQRARLSCFVEVTAPDRPGYKRFDSYTSTECQSNVSYAAEEHTNRDYSAILDESF